jgi:hypothetical protein
VFEILERIATIVTDATIELLKKNRFIFVLFAAAILLSMVREWSAPAVCPRVRLIDPSLSSG